MILISAMTHDRVIGDRGALPWSIPDEYRQFLDQVEGQATILGRASYEIFGPDLTARSPLVVVSRSVDALPDATVCASLEAAIDTARGLATKRVYCAGGASIYALAVPHATRMHLSFVRRAYAGDAFFPEFDAAAWSVERTVEHAEFEYREYARR